MVWHEVGKYGVHHGRTLRSPPKPARASHHNKAGYIAKVIVNRTKMLDTDEIQSCLKTFRIADGFDNDFVVAESHHRSYEDHEWAARGFQSYDTVLSINKKKRWLLPQLLREKLHEDGETSDGEASLKPRVVLVERKSVDSNDYESLSSKLKRGDCSDVLDSHATEFPVASPTREGKKRKYCHVGDKYTRSIETEITYEVCHSMSAKSWPNMWETRARSHPIKFDGWYGDIRKHTKKPKRNEMMKHCLNDVDMMDDFDDDDDDDDIPAVQSAGAKTYDFDLDVYLTKALKCKSDDVQGRTSAKIHHDNKPNHKLTRNFNPASSEAVACYGKGCVQLIDREEDMNTEDSKSFPNIPPEPMAQSTMETNTVVKEFKLSILIDSLHTDDLQERFKSRYREGKSVPRKFFIGAPFCRHQYLLFETHYDREADQNVSCEVLVTLICDDRENTYSHESDSYIITNSCNRLVQLESQKKSLAISDIVNIFDKSCKCCHETVDSKGRCDAKEESLKIRKTAIAYDVLNSFIGHKTEVHSLDKAPKEVFFVPCHKLPDQTAGKTLDDQYSMNCASHSKTCEICYSESSDLDQGFTALMACNHWFCNDCWKMHLVAQLQLGKTMVSCPALKCPEVVDDATFMSLAPKSYFRYKTFQQDKALEMNKQWNWCPGDKCRLVAKVTKCQDNGIPRDDVDVKEACLLPCMCSCSHTWCFGCQDEPHWPVSCNQAHAFRSQTKKYQETIATNGDDLVTSVSVKRCPKCQYPIEKNGGCPHMNCSKCQADFCWKCLDVFDYENPHHCGEQVTSEEIELTDFIGNARFNKHAKIMITHKKARKVEHLFKMYKQVEDIANAVAAHHKLMQHKLLNVKTPSKAHAFLALCHEHNVPEKLKLMVDIKFVSHSVIEGASMHMATSKTKQGHHVLERLTNDLQFVIFRLDYYLGLKLEDVCAALDQTTALVEAAKAMIIAIGQVTRELADKH